MATTTSAPPRSAPACRPIDMPPTTVASRSRSGAGVRGERVGDLLGQLPGGHQDQGQRLPRLGAPARRCGPAAARPKARVLPEPVRPRPSTSRPASEFGSVAAWIGNGSCTPWAVRVFSRAGGSRARRTPSTAAARGSPSRVPKFTLRGGRPFLAAGAAGHLRARTTGRAGAVVVPGRTVHGRTFLDGARIEGIPGAGAAGESPERAEDKTVTDSGWSRDTAWGPAASCVPTPGTEVCGIALPREFTRPARLPVRIRGPQRANSLRNGHAAVPRRGRAFPPAVDVGRAARAAQRAAGPQAAGTAAAPDASCEAPPTAMPARIGRTRV